MAAASPVDVTTRPTLNAVLSTARRLTTWATTATTANTSTTNAGGTSRIKRTKNPSSMSNTSDLSWTKRVMGQIQLAAMSAPKTTAKMIAVAPGQPPMTTLWSATATTASPEVTQASTTSHPTFESLVVRSPVTGPATGRDAGLPRHPSCETTS